MQMLIQTFRFHVEIIHSGSRKCYIDFAKDRNTLQDVRQNDQRSLFPVEHWWRETGDLSMFFHANVEVTVQMGRKRVDEKRNEICLTKYFR